MTTDLPAHSRRRRLAFAGLLSGALLFLVALAAPSAWAWDLSGEAGGIPGEHASQSAQPATPEPAADDPSEAPTAQAAGTDLDEPEVAAAVVVGATGQPGVSAVEDANDLLQEIPGGGDGKPAPKDTVSGEMRSLLTVSGAASPAAGTTDPGGAGGDAAPAPPLWQLREPDQVDLAALPPSEEPGDDPALPDAQSAPEGNEPLSGGNDWRGQWAAVKRLEAREEQIADIETAVEPELPEVRTELTAARLQVGWASQGLAYLADVADARAKYDAAKDGYDALRAKAAQERFSMPSWDPTTWFGLQERYLAQEARLDVDMTADRLELQQHDAYQAIPVLSGWLGLEPTGVTDEDRKAELDEVMAEASALVARLEREEYLATARVGALAADQLWPLVHDATQAALRVEEHGRDMAEHTYEAAKDHRLQIDDVLKALPPSSPDYEERLESLERDRSRAFDEESRTWRLLQEAEDRVERWGH